MIEAIKQASFELDTETHDLIQPVWFVRTIQHGEVSSLCLTNNDLFYKGHK